MDRRFLVGGVLLCVLALAATIPVTAQPGTPQPTVLRAADRVEAAIAWSRHAIADGEGTLALLARHDDFADALASGTAQVRAGAPLLLTPSGALDARVATELDRLGVDRVVLLGGPAAVSDEVAEDLRSRGYAVERLAGDTRITTAIAIARRFGDPRDRVVLARAFGDADDPTRAFADALAAGPTGTILLTATEALSQPTADHLMAAGITSVQVAGGEAAISAAVVEELEAAGISVTRRSGSTRFTTAGALELIRHTQFPPTGYILIDGTGPDAWAAGLPAALSAGRSASAIVLSAGEVLPSVTAARLLPPRRTTCGPLLPAAACTTAAMLQTASQTFSPGGTLVAAARADASGGASGLVQLLRTQTPGTLCYRYDPIDVGALQAVRIERDDGHVVADLGLDTNWTHRPDAGPRGYGCVTDADPQDVDQAFTSPRGFRAAVVPAAGAPLTGTFGAISRDRASAFGRGTDVVGGGHPDATVNMQVLFTDDPGEVCMLYQVHHLEDEITDVHLHAGDPGEEGRLLADVPTASSSGGAAACVTVDAEVVAGMPEDVATYIDVHTRAHPDGAVRAAVTTPPTPPPI